MRASTGAAALIPVLLLGCAHTPAIRDDSGERPKGSLASFERVRMDDGLEELVLVRGANPEAAPIIYVHGGPGSSELVPFRYYCSSLERDFIVVNWEQRGSGKLFDRRKIPAPPTIERHLEDLRAVVAWAAERFPGRKPSLVCHSWGTYLGLVYASRYPETIERYIGSGQDVRPAESERLSLLALLERAKRDGPKGNARAIRELKSLDDGLPYGDASDPEALRKARTERAWNLFYGGEIYGAKDYAIMTKAFFASTEYSLFDFARYGLASGYSLSALWPAFLATDLSKEATSFEVPVHILQGRHDLTTNASLVQPYFDSISAPRKELIWFERSAHLPMYEESEKWCAEVKRIMLAPVGRVE
jgi:pimeloyl-ACP methyl ester carboxylesterase